MAATAYEYKKLPALREFGDSSYIRLLRLLPRKDPSDPDETIRCVLFPSQLKDVDHRYTAISYMWGGRDADRLIELDDASFSVTENLWTCLRKLRNQITSEADVNSIWVDAICINQQDSDERSSQVSQMGEIYAKAEVVVIWPRDPTRKLENASILRTMHFIRTIIESKQKEKNISFATHFLSFYQDPECDQRWPELAALCQTEYWSRVWIVQETVLASKVVLQCEDGDKSLTSRLDWEDFMQVCHALADLPANWPISDSVLAVRESLPLRLDSRRKSRSKESPIESLLAIFEDSRSSEARDKIYGLLSLTDSQIKGAISVNYSMTMFEVYVDVVWAYGAKKEATSQICSFGQLVQRSLGGPFPLHSLANPEFSDRPLLILSALSKGAILPIDNISSALAGPAVISRKRLEALHQCFQSLTYPIDDQDTYLASALNQLEQIPSRYLAAIQSSSSYVSDVQLPYRPRDSWVNQLEQITSRYLATTQPLFSYFSDMLIPDQPRDLWDMPPKSSQQKTQTRLFLGINGEIGLAASCIREDDILCQFANCDTAAIVRRKEADQYHIVSRAVVAKRNGEEDVRQDKLSPAIFRYNVPVPNSGPPLFFYLDGYVLQELTCPLNLKPVSSPSDMRSRTSI